MTPASLVRRAMWSARLALRNTLRYWRLLERWQWLAPQEHMALVEQRLADLLRHASTHVPYYRDLFREVGLVDATGKPIRERFAALPLLDRGTVRVQFDRLVADDHVRRGCTLDTTGGSTGEPVRFLRDRETVDWHNALSILFDAWSGYSLCEPRIWLWGSERDLFVGRETWKTRFSRWMRNEIWLNAFRMTPEQMRQYARIIAVQRPVQVHAYVNCAYELARFAQREQLSLGHPKCVMLGAGTVTAEIRQTVESAFGAPVFNRYGSRDAGNIACECDRHGGLHVAMPAVYLEVLRPDGTPVLPGETGEIVVTLLTNFAMPFIRYRIGDIGAWATKPCSCGRSWPLLQEVSGRVTDVFLKRDGGVVLPEYLIHLVGVVLNTGWIDKYQVVQEDYDRVRVRICPMDPSLSPADRQVETDAIADRIRMVMGQDCAVQIDFVDNIPPEPSGKYRYTISHVPRG